MAEHLALVRFWKNGHDEEDVCFPEIDDPVSAGFHLSEFAHP